MPSRPKSSFPATLSALTRLIRDGEGPTLEFKKTTGELKDGMKTLCAFLNGDVGGTVFFGIRPNGVIAGQHVSDQTMRDIAQVLDHIEPSTQTAIKRIKVKDGLEVIAVSASRNNIHGPFTFEGRPYERVSRLCIRDRNHP